MQLHLIEATPSTHSRIHLAIVVSLLYACSIAAPSLFAQAPQFRITHYTTNDGLSQNYVYCAMQDSRGYLWFGTRDGLNRFDGYEFKQFHHEPFGENCLSHNVVMAVVEDRDGFLWIGTNGGGLNRYDRKRGEFIHLHHDPKNEKSISSDGIFSLHLGRDGLLWIGTVGGSLCNFDVAEFNRCLKLNRNAEPPAFRRYPKHTALRNGPSGDVIHSLTEDHAGRIWMQTNVLTSRYDPQRDSWTHFFGNPVTRISIEDSTLMRVRMGSSMKHEITTSSNGSVYTAPGVSVYREESKRFHAVYPLNVQCFFEDRGGCLWVGGLDGLFLIPQPDGEIKPIPVSLDKSGSSPLPRQTIQCIRQDYNGSIWVGTDAGLFKLQEGASGFSLLQLQAKMDFQQRPINVRAIFEKRDHEIIIGTVGDWLFRINPETKFAVPIEPVGGRRAYSGEKYVNAIHQQSDGSYFLFSGIGMYEWNPVRGVIQMFGYDWPRKWPVSHSNLFSFLRDRDLRMWIGGSNMRQGVLYRYDIITDSLVPIHNRFVTAPGFDCGSGVWKLYETRNGEIWIGTTNGLFKFDPEKTTFTHFKHNPKDPSTLSENEIWTIHESNDGTLWIGTLGGGLNAFDRQTGKFKSYTMRHGLANNYVCCILEDAHGKLWMSTNKGIARFDPATRTFTNFNAYEIQAAGGFSFGSGLRASDGRLYFGGAKGLLVFHPDSIKQSTFKPPVVITKCEILGERREGEFTRGDTLTLQAHENHLTFEFASLDFSNTINNRYAYMLMGVDPGWIESGSRRTCTYSNLQPGIYSLHIKGTNSDGVWNERGTTIFMRIVPPMYRTVWFRYLLAIVITIIIGGLVLWRVDYINRRERNKRRLVESELHALRLQMNPHFFFNSLNAIQSYIITKRPNEAVSYLAKFARLMRLILENSKKASVEIREELELLRIYIELESIRFDNRFETTFDVDPTIDESGRIPSMLIQPYVENAIRHGLVQRGQGGKLLIAMRNVDTAIECVIEDNGVGRARTQASQRDVGRTTKPMGMDITQARLEILATMHRKEMVADVIDLHDGDGQPAGTRVVIRIPVEPPLTHHRETQP